MRKARIYRRARSTMQSGKARTHDWVLELLVPKLQAPEPIMGWISAAAPRLHRPLEFPTLDAAIAYARDEGIEAVVDPIDPETAPRPKAYSDNFSMRRRENWTH